MSARHFVLTASLYLFVFGDFAFAQVPASPRPVDQIIQPAVPGAGTVLSVSPVQEFGLPELAERIPKFFEAFPAPSPRYRVRKWDIQFRSTDFDGSPVTIRSQLFVPVIGREENRSVYVFASGTTGISDASAPSLEQPELIRWGWYRENMLAYATLGYIVMFPDYTGFHDPERAQRYFSKYAEGYMMLDAIRAVFDFFERHDGRLLPERPSRAVFTAGYSQGGHAAMAAADLRPLYAPAVPLAGVITYGSTNDIEALLREGVAYTPAILYSFREMYGRDSLNIADYLQPRFVPNFDREAIASVDVFQVHYGFSAETVYTPAFLEALRSRTLETEFRNLWVMGEENDTGLSGHGLPALVIQGSQDFIVTDASQTEFVTKLRSAGSNVRFLIYPQSSHRYTRHSGFQASITWMQEQAARINTR